jgi:L-2,4-diaminobutyrate decarboxylase
MSGAAADDSTALVTQFEELVRLSLSRGQNLHHPRYVGHQVPASLPLVGLFDAVTMLTNQVQGVYEMGPWAVSVERAVLQHIGEVIGFHPGEFAGLITSGGSLANLTALLAARNLACGDIWRSGADIHDQRPVLVVQADAHYCVDRAAGVMGIGTDHVIRVPLDDDRRMNVSELDRILAGLIARGVPIVAVVAVACTTPTGAFDPIDEIADVCAEHRVWLHVDAAHGGGVCFSDKHRHLARGLHRADSVVVDAHKMMFLPAVCAMVFYKHSEHRFAAFQQSAPYLFDPSAPELADFDNAVVTFECTKRAAALGLWGVWSMFGKPLFEALVDRVIDTATRFHELIVDHESFAASCVPTCNIVVFRYLPPELRDASPEQIDTVQLELRRSVLESGQAYLTQTRLDGRIHLRSTIMNPLTDESHLNEILESLSEQGRRLAFS